MGSKSRFTIDVPKQFSIFRAGLFPCLCCAVVFDQHIHSRQRIHWT